MPRRAVIFDLDDTLIVEQSFAMASLREAIAVFPGVDPVADEADALEAVRSACGPTALNGSNWPGRCKRAG